MHIAHSINIYLLFFEYCRGGLLNVILHREIQKGAGLATEAGLTLNK